MHDRSSRGDENDAAFGIVQQATGAVVPAKNPAAVALGKLGGLKGGDARAKKLSPKRRKAIATKAARARWDKSAGRNA